MEISETYNYLYRVRNIDKRIANMRAEQDALRLCLMPSGIRYDKDAVQTSPSDQMSEVMAKIAEIGDRIKMENEERAEQVIEIISKIKCLDNHEERTVLIDFYLARKSMYMISRDLPCSRMTAYNIRDRAVKHLAALL